MSNCEKLKEVLDENERLKLKIAHMETYIRSALHYTGYADRNFEYIEDMWKNSEDPENVNNARIAISLKHALLDNIDKIKTEQKIIKIQQRRSEIEILAMQKLKYFSELFANKDDLKYLPPNDKFGFLKKIVAFLGGKIAISETPCSLEETHGSLEIQADGSFTIYLNPLDTPIKDTARVAHDLGHYFLHYKYAPQGEYKLPLSFRRHGNGQLEVEADIFASEFLIPTRRFIQAFNSFCPQTAKQSIQLYLASIFSVPIKLIEKRIKEFRLE